jgi:hypothetical protein
VAKETRCRHCEEIAESVISGRKSGAEMARLYHISSPTVSRIVARHRNGSPSRADVIYHLAQFPNFPNFGNFRNPASSPFQNFPNFPNFGNFPNFPNVF